MYVCVYILNKQYACMYIETKKKTNSNQATRYPQKTTAITGK